MLVFHIGILTDTERSKAAKCKTATHLNIFFPLLTEQESHINCISVEQEQGRSKSQSCSIHFLIAMRGGAPSWQSWTTLPLLCCIEMMLWLGRGRGSRQGVGCGDVQVPETQQSKLVAWKSLCPMWCDNVAYTDLVCLDSQILAGRKDCERASASAGRFRLLWQRQAGRTANGQQELAGPPHGKLLITLWAGRSAGRFIDSEVCFLEQRSSPKWTFSLRKLFSHQLQFFS